MKKMGFLKYICIAVIVFCTMGEAKAQTAADSAWAKKMTDSAAGQMAMRDYNGAIDLYTALLDSKFKLPVFWYNRANAESFLDQYAEAVRDYDSALVYDSSIILAYMNQAYMYMKLNKTEAAMHDYELGIRYSQDSNLTANLYISRGNAYIAMNHFADAEKDFTAAIKYRDNSFQAYLQRGAVRRKLHKTKAALEDLNMANKLQPNTPDVLLLRGILKVDLKDYKGAIKDLTANLKIEKNNDAYYYRGMARMSLGQDSLAVRDFTTIINNNDHYIAAYNGRAQANYKLKHPKLAIEDYTLMIEINPASGESYANRGFVYSTLKMKDKACADWHKASELGVKAADEAIKKYCK